MSGGWAALLTTVAVLFVPRSAFAGQQAPQVVDLLPDLIVREADLYSYDIVTNIIPGHVHLRFANGTPNIGPGKLHFFGVLPPVNDSQQVVDQRVYRSDGTFYDRQAGIFEYHPSHNHVHFNGWCQYRLRQILPNDGVGPIVMEADKTSFCVVDLAVYDRTLQNYNPFGEFFQCGPDKQGLSVGWMDIYGRSTEGQNIDITNVTAGTYWLESQVNPDSGVLESDYSNNFARIKVSIGLSGPLLPDPYEPNESIAQVSGRPVGGINSPNLGPCNPKLIIPNLSIHQSADKDFFRFYANSTGAVGDFVQITFVHSGGDLDMRLYNSAGTVVGTSNGTSNSETISLLNKPKGWYSANVYGYNSATNPNYTLTIDPPANNSPVVTVIDPPLGNVSRILGFENYTTTWSASDPDLDPTWVTVYVNILPDLDSNLFQLETSLHTDGATGFHVINSAVLPAGTYWVYCEITDGGTTTGGWSPGTVTFVNAVDSDSDGWFDNVDNCPHFPNPDQIGCPYQGDPVPDGITDVFDVVKTVSVAFRNANPILDSTCPHGPGGRTDLNCDGATDITDVIMMIDVAFRGIARNFCNPCACNPYPGNCPAP